MPNAKQAYKELSEKYTLYPRKYKSKGRQFTVNLEKENINFENKTLRLSSYATVYYSNNEELKQIEINTYICNIRENKSFEPKLREQLKNQIATISKDITGNEFMINDSNFKKLGPNWLSKPRIKLKESATHVRSMKLQKSLYKCDSKGGYGYRFDFFI